MPLTQTIDFFRECSAQTNSQRVSEKLVARVAEVLRETWYLGFTAFGGPPVHFQIFYNKFVAIPIPSHQSQEDQHGGTWLKKKKKRNAAWIDEQTYQELFALCQALPGPGSTKFLTAVAFLHAGPIPALIAFLVWSLPGAIGMFALALGVRRISETLPDPAYGFLSGLNASTVGIIAVAGVQLAEKCIKDPLSRILVLWGACAGLCYSALWYYPVLVAIGGLTTVLWDLWLGREVRRGLSRWEARRKRRRSEAATDLTGRVEGNPTVERASEAERDDIQPEVRTPEPLVVSNHDASLVQRRNVHTPSSEPSTTSGFVCVSAATTMSPQQQSQINNIPTTKTYDISVRSGLIILILFIISFVVVMVTRSELRTELRPFSLFANMYLAGTIIFGGGPVVIPLLREYVVYPGWVSPRDFLIGLAIIQAFPGPNFNFSVYLGALTLSSWNEGQLGSVGGPLLGAVLGYVGIFLPGQLISLCFQGFWRKVRSRPLMIALLRGINATAVGLVFTAVYRLWNVGYLTNSSGSGEASVPSRRTQSRSLADEPWWVVVAVVAYAGHMWFKIPAAVGIAAGGILGIAWWGATQR